MEPNKQPLTPKSIGKSGLPNNYRRMKQKLQLKVEVNEPNIQKDKEALKEEAISSELLYKEEVPPADEDDTEEVQSMDEKKNVNNLFNRGSPMRLVWVCKAMTKPQRDLIINSEFGGFLNMKCSKLIPELCRFLMDCFNPDRCELDFGPRGRVPGTVQSIHRIMGVPMGSIPVAYQMDSQSTGVIMEMFGIPNGRQPSITSVETQLGPTYPANNDYLRKFTIFSVSTVFAPTTCTRVSPKCYPPVINTEAIKRLNWAKFTIDILIQTSKAKGIKNRFKACMPYLMVLYVDSLETDAIDVPEKGTRICIWTNKMINQIVTLDTHIDGSFEKLPACFRNKFSMFSLDPSIVDMFIKRHVLGILSEEVRRRS